MNCKYFHRCCKPLSLLLQQHTIEDTGNQLRPELHHAVTADRQLPAKQAG